MLGKNNIPSVSDLFAADPDRGRRFCVRQSSWLFDYSRLPLTDAHCDELWQLPERARLGEAVERLFAGELVNPSESQPALHMALRASDPATFPGAGAELVEQRDRFLELAGHWHDGEGGFDDLLHIGIGGSDLGPRLVAEALDADTSKLRVHWLSTLDGRRLARLLASLDPDRTGVVIASKSFSTEETLTQAVAVRDWLGERFAERAWAATARPDRAVDFGIAPASVLPFPAWTGGRFSLWSSVGVSAAACIGPARFSELLAGAAAADHSFRAGAGSGEGLATGLALAMHWLRRGLDLPTLGFVSYEPRLALLGDYLQQLIMESLGKSVDSAGGDIDAPTAPLIFGGRGTDLQHSIFQALHQGPDTHPLVLVGSLNDDHAFPGWHRTQLAHLLAQARALTDGRQTGQAHQRMPGNRPVSLLLTERLTPAALGELLAGFEHAVYALSVLWGINPFDQWGVEEGKRLAGKIRPTLEGVDRLDDLQNLPGGPCG